MVQIPLCFSSCAKNSPRSCRCTEKVDLFFVMGLPSILHSDNGQEFVNKLIDEVFATCRGIVLMQHHKRISCCLMNGWMILLLQLYKTCCDKRTQLSEGFNHHHLHRSLQWSHRQGNLIVQVLNVSGNHWITISTISCEASTLNEYDSMHGNLPTSAQRLVADLVQCHRSAVHWFAVAKCMRNWLWSFCFGFLPLHCGVAKTPQPQATSRDRWGVISLVFCYLKIFNRFLHEVSGAKFSSLERNLFLCTASVVWQTLEQCSSCDEWYHTACICVPKSTSHLT